MAGLDLGACMKTNVASGSDWARLWKQAAQLHKLTNRFIFKYLSRHVLVEDIVAETLRYASEHPEQWSHIPDDRLIFYLRRKARLLVIDQARKLHRHREVLADSPLQLSGAKTEERFELPSPSVLAHKGEKKKAARRILERLPNENHREILRLVWIEGLTVVKASERMRRSPEAGQMLLGRAFRACRALARRDSFRGFRVSGETK